jgi:hypothetical protein
MGQSAGVFDPSHTSPPISGCYHCTDPYPNGTMYFPAEHE